jgi:hypothetical protein
MILTIDAVIEWLGLIAVVFVEGSDLKLELAV